MPRPDDLGVNLRPNEFEEASVAEAGGIGDRAAGMPGVRLEILDGADEGVGCLGPEGRSGSRSVAAVPVRGRRDPGKESGPGCRSSR